MSFNKHFCKTTRHTTHFISAGFESNQLIIFLHGWPELGLMWEDQLNYFASLGFYAVAPDLRGYGKSSIHTECEKYSIEEVVNDMLELLKHLGHPSAIWVGHDWGVPVIWSFARQNPDKSDGIVSLCIPYIPDGFAPSNLIPLVNRAIYPEDIYPAGQWDYLLYYEESFSAALQTFESSIPNFLKIIFRSPDRDGAHKPYPTASIRRNGGWFGGSFKIPDYPRDTAILRDADFERYVLAFENTGFFGPNAYYMNNERNVIDTAKLARTKEIFVPVLFVHAKSDWICDTLSSNLADPMRACCKNLTEIIIDSGHWIVQEKPGEVSTAIETWIEDQKLYKKASSHQRDIFS